jgi:hypothetical protein
MPHKISPQIKSLKKSPQVMQQSMKTIARWNALDAKIFTIGFEKETPTKNPWVYLQSYRKRGSI